MFIDKNGDSVTVNDWVKYLGNQDKDKEIYKDQIGRIFKFESQMSDHINIRGPVSGILLSVHELQVEKTLAPNMKSLQAKIDLEEAARNMKASINSEKKEGE